MWFENTLVNVIEADKFNDDKPWLLKEKKCSFVLFFADWCGHCKNLKPEYIKFADKAQFINIYAVDSTSQENLLKRINSVPESPVKITGYPTILIYCNGEFKEEYNGKNTWQALLEKAMKMCDGACKCQ